MIGSIYKLLAKVLARRFSKSLKSIISECQNTFIEGRQITDAIMIANEVVDDLSCNKNRGILCKLNMQKAFHNVSWDLLITCLINLVMEPNGGDGSEHAFPLLALLP